MSRVRHGETDSFAGPCYLRDHSSTAVQPHGCPSRATTVAVQRIAATTVVEIDKGPQQWLKLTRGADVQIWPPGHKGWPLELVAMLPVACATGQGINTPIGCGICQGPHLFPSFVLCE